MSEPNQTVGVTTSTFEDIALNFDNELHCEVPHDGCTHLVTHRGTDCAIAVLICHMYAAEVTHDMAENIHTCVRCKRKLRECWTIKPFG